MTNTRRNTLVLTVLFLLLAGIAFSLFHNLNAKAKVLKTANNVTRKKIAVLTSQISNIDSLKMEYAIRTAMVAEQSKVIVASDTPTSTYQYLLRMLNWMDRNIVFDFAISTKGKKETNWNEYVISGRADYLDVLAFTRNIEHQRALLTVEELAIGSDAVANSDTVSFSMVIRTHFNQGGVKIEDLKPKQMSSGSSSYQLFRSRLYDAIPVSTTIDPTLVILEQCKLIGITDNRIFVRNEQGVIKILALQDKVAYGYLYAINAVEGKAIFMIDKFGFPEEQVLKLATTN